MGATLQRQMIGSRTGLLVAATVSPYIKPPDDKEKPTKIIFKNRSQKKIKIKVDADRQMDSIVKNGWSVEADLGFSGVGIGGKGSWLMIAENHSILKRCNVAYSDGSTNESRLPGIHVNHRGVDQIIPSFNGKYAKLEEDYKLGLVQVSNRSNFEVLVKVDSECINTKKMKSEIGGSLQGEVKSFASKLKLGK
uniref:Uncharacterized protein n=1 Tax=Panagrolaimus sp. ES5 TaxID=591445 RepID=A0AC34G893_9BILA